MSPGKKRIFLLAVPVLVCLTAFFVFRMKNNDESNEGFIISDNKVITYETARTAEKYRAGRDIDDPGAVVSKQDKGIRIGPDTLAFMRFLMNSFPECTEKSCNLDKVRQYLFGRFPKDQAEDLFRTYNLFLDCEEKVSGSDNTFSHAKTMDEMVDILRQRQELRRKILGGGLADALYGAEVKMQEYRIRDSIIISDASLYGAQKEEEMRKLDQEMWGGAPGKSDDRPAYEKYQEMLLIYGKDIDEAQASGKSDQVIRQLRERYFDKETLEMLESNDAALEAMDVQEKAYEEARSRIMNDPEIDDRKKEQLILELQDSTFGPEHAEKIRRKERMEEGLNTVLK